MVGLLTHKSDRTNRKTEPAMPSAMQAGHALSDKIQGKHDRRSISDSRRPSLATRIPAVSKEEPRLVSGNLISPWGDAAQPERLKDRPLVQLITAE